jgi:hypothetical protein
MDNRVVFAPLIHARYAVAITITFANPYEVRYQEFVPIVRLMKEKDKSYARNKHR